MEGLRPHAAGPAPTLHVRDAVLVVVGLVIGAGIFKAPQLVAANSASELAMLGLWVVGAGIALLGALCYAELASTYPNAGGDYHFLTRAFGRSTGFLFAWSRMTVLQTGSIALLAFAYGDYASELVPLPATVHAALAIVAFTAVNLAGIRAGTRTQGAFTAMEIAGVVAIAFAGLVFGSAGPEFGGTAMAAVPAAPVPAVVPVGEATAAPAASLGLALVFVMLTYGGWNEAAYLSAEVAGRRGIVRALVLGLGVVALLYLVVNLAYVRGLGLDGMAASDAVAADLMRTVAGEPGAAFVAALVALAALTSINATIITGARSNFALGRDFPALRLLGGWNERAGTPTHALLVQGAIALLLVAVGAATRSGFATLVEYTAPVFWAFFLLTGVALFRLRRADPLAHRPFTVPLYPLTPLAFCATSAWMLGSSLTHAGTGALAGLAVLAAGLPALWIARRHESLESTRRPR
jgi:amino acid transporter